MSNDNQNYRQLRAIIFADIVGYTTMMQDGENAALLTLKRFESITQEYVNKYQGEVIKNYGDGSLILFDSTVHAVQCAHDMQIAFQQEPKVPLRIGIHIGEVVRRDKDIFGHGVNISSRIESLGVAGSVLVSKMIYDKVRNQEDFTFKSLGTFDFKNVDEGIQVFALANQGITVPRPSEMKGKVKETKNSFWSNPTVRSIGIAAFVLFFVIGGVSMLSKGNAQKPITETVNYVDENGEAKERLIFNRSMNNRILIFPPKNVGPEDTNDKWINLAIAELQMTDLELDNRLLAISPRSLVSDLKAKGIDDYDNVSFGLKRKLASEKYVDYFIDSEINNKGGQYEINFKLHQTSDGKEVLSKNYSNTDLFVMVDAFSADLNQYLYEKIDKQSDIPSYVDLPSNETLTNDIVALKDYIKAQYAIYESNDVEGALNSLDKAIERDPNFFMATYLKGSILIPSGRMTEGLEYFEKALAMADGQSERTQLAVKCQYYLYQNDVDKATRLAEMWKSLYPQNEEAYRILGTIYQMTGDFGKYQEVYQDGYDNGHKGSFLLTLGSLHTERGEFDKATEYFQEFQDLYPTKTDEITQLGDLYLKQGKFDEAIEYFENRTIKDDQNVNNHITLGGAYLKKGEFKNASNSYQTALSKSKIARDSFAVLNAMSDLAYLQGQADAFIETFELKIKTYEKIAPKLMVDMQYVAFNAVDKFKDCGRLDIVDKKFKAFNATSDMGDINWECIMEYNKSIGLEDAVLLDKAKSACPEDLAKAMGPAQVKLLTALERNIKGEYEGSITLMNEFIEETNSPRSSFSPFFADVKTKLGAFNESIELMTNYLKTDNSSADSYVLLAKAYKGNGDAAQAKEALEKALEIWKNADDSFIPAQEAKVLMMEL